MARIYAIGEIPGLAAQIETHVEGEIIPPGEELPEGTENYDLTLWYRVTEADIEAGASRGMRIPIALRNVPINESNADVRAEIMRLRAEIRAEKKFDSSGKDQVWISE